MNTPDTTMNSMNSDFRLARFNPSNRCPVALLLDTSSSMDGPPIRELEQGLRSFIHEVNADSIARNSVELAVITFGNNGVKIAQRFTEVSKINADALSLTAGGMTPMGEAVTLGLKEVKARRDWFKREGLKAYRPWVILITDGGPNDNWQDAAAELRQLDAEKKVMALGIGVQGADMGTLARFTSRQPQQLAGLKFAEFFKWLTDSLVQTTTRSTPDSAPGSVQLPNPAASPATNWLSYH